MRTMRARFLLTIALAAAWPPAEAAAQLDPLLFLKRTESNVLVLMDTSDRMQRDGRKHDDAADKPNYYDPNIYTVKGELWEAALGLSAYSPGTKYRRKYVNLRHKPGAGERFDVDQLVAVPNSAATAAAFEQFESKTRLSVARAALTAAIKQNTTTVRWGLLKMRQSNPKADPEKTSGQAKVTANAAQEATTDSSGAGKWDITRTSVDAGKDNGAIASVTAPLVSPATGTYQQVLDYLANDVSHGGKLIPAGIDDHDSVDSPIENLLEDAHVEALKLVVDVKCRNTAAILITGGGEGNTDAGANPVSSASKFLLDLMGRRVPIYVIAVALGADAASNTERAQLKDIAAKSGGAYTEITKARIDEINNLAPGTAVPEFVRAINYAVQKTYVEPTTFNIAPTAALAEGPGQEFQVTSPIVGTVNLENAKDITGTTLVNSVIYKKGSSGSLPEDKIPQRSNLMITTGFELPGFHGRIRGFRVYTPEKDDATSIGYKFKASGTRLWVASAPASSSRNIYTALPDGTMVPFDTTSAALLAPYLGGSSALSVTDASALINYVRSQPLGAVVGSTPAIMDPPSLDPPPDSEYPAFVEKNKLRRSIIWAGANDGMLHAIDARLGVEVWAYVPFNLLPKLKALQSGQAVDTFSYFVDSSPKVADVKVAGKWRSYLTIGEGAGGTFYQSFDVTMDDMGLTVTPDSDDIGKVLTYFKAPTSVPLKWSFPRYSVFDHTVGTYGDVGSAATDVERTVGETWSDPAVGQIESGTGPYVVLVGSGFLKYSVQEQANRGGTVAGTTFYVLSAETGSVFASQAVGSDAKAEKIDDCRTANDCTQIKNALQADPVATGPADSRFITKVYMGDLDGRIWRFDLGLDAAKKPKFMQAAPTKLFDAGREHPMFTSMATVNIGATQQYLFQGTGSDLLPSNGVSQNYKLLVVLDNGGSGSKTAEVLLDKVDSQAGEEKVTAFPAVAGDIVFFATTTEKLTVFCTPRFDANLYGFTFIGGPAYDTNKDGTLSAKTGDSTRLQSTSGARASAPFIVDQHLVFAAGNTIEMFGDPSDFNNGVGQAGVRILSWREVR